MPPKQQTFESETKTRMEQRMRQTTGFTLNGANMKLKGVCLHHDAECVWRRRLRKLKAAGCNAIR